MDRGHPARRAQLRHVLKHLPRLVVRNETEHALAGRHIRCIVQERPGRTAIRGKFDPRRTQRNLQHPECLAIDQAGVERVLRQPYRAAARHLVELLPGRIALSLSRPAATP